MITTCEINPYLGKLLPEQLRMIAASNARFVGFSDEGKFAMNEFTTQEKFKKFLLNDVRSYINYWLSHRLCLIDGPEKTPVWYSKTDAKPFLDKIINPEWLNTYKTHKYKYATVNEDGFVAAFEFLPLYNKEVKRFDLRNLRDVVNSLKF